MVKSALTGTALLFLGFQLDDWTFRVLFRTLMGQKRGASNGDGKPHVAVQLDPEDDRVVNPERARRYLEEYFGNDDINVYWGSVEDFVADLRAEQERSGCGRRRSQPVSVPP